MSFIESGRAGADQHKRGGPEVPAGDAQRVWFPEQLNILYKTWSKSLTWEEFADLLSRLTEERKELRRARGIRPPLFRCPKCGVESRSEHSLSIRSALFALRTAGILKGEDFDRLDRDWKKYRAVHDLDPYGKKNKPSADVTKGEHSGCC